jgi:hypothetical protein
LFEEQYRGGLLCQDICAPLTIVEALITAAIDENIHLRLCILFDIRREPDGLQKLLPSAVAVVAFDNNNDDSASNNDESSTEIIVTKIIVKSEKAKKKG